LKRYGYIKEANTFVEQLLHNAEGLMGDYSIRENHHPLTGKGIKTINSSWSAGHLLMMPKN
jgi:putative isomerase